MKTHNIHIWEKVKTWRVYGVEIKAKSKEEAIETAKTFITEGFVDVPENVDYESWIDHDLEEGVNPEENDGKATLEIYYENEHDIAHKNA